MNSRRYSLLGWIVWKVAGWFVRRKARERRGALAAIAVIVAVVLGGMLLAHADSDD